MGGEWGASSGTKMLGVSRLSHLVLLTLRGSAFYSAMSRSAILVASMTLRKKNRGGWKRDGAA